MALSESRKRANKKWNEKHLESLTISLPIGTRAVWKEYASASGASLAKFIQSAVREKAGREGLAAEDPEEEGQDHPEDGAQRSA